jgi:hypothetical protein
MSIQASIALMERARNLGLEARRKFSRMMGREPNEDFVLDARNNDGQFAVMQWPCDKHLLLHRGVDVTLTANLSQNWSRAF